MKILWVYGDFLHPTTRGGQIRTLETLKRLHRRHEVHYAGLWHPENREGPARANEYASHIYPIRHHVADKTSAAFALDLLKGLISPLPVAVFRHRSAEMRTTVDRLRRDIPFDVVVCDFLSSAPHFSDLSDVVLFQHNVEAIIWQRHIENAPTTFHRAYFRLQARRMLEYERQVCNAVKSIIAVSEADANRMRGMYRASRVSVAPTGVDVDFFTPKAKVSRDIDFAFVGSMDWMPNVDGVLWFADHVLPLIRQKLPRCELAIVGRKPSEELSKLGERDPAIRITGTVDDVRPWLWRSKVSIVPLRIGGGTRLKIYEAMAARTPVVSTSIGAEGLNISHGENILLAETPEQFAEACVRLIADANERQRLADAAWAHVSSRHSWDAAAAEFENLLKR